MMLFFNWTGLERIGVIGPEIRMLLGWSAGSGSSGRRYVRGWAGLKALGVALLCKNKKEGGSARLRPWPLRCLSQFLAERKDRLLRGRMFLCTFNRWDDLVFIVHIIPNWRVVKILSHWMRYFLPLSDFNKGY